MLPVENEEELNEDTSERQNAAHDNTGQGPRVKQLCGYLARYLIGAGRILDDGTLEAEVGADEDERRADEEPEGEHGEQGEEGHGGGGLVGPQHQVEHEEGGEDKARAQQGANEDTTDP